MTKQDWTDLLDMVKKDNDNVWCGASFIDGKALYTAIMDGYINAYGDDAYTVRDTIIEYSDTMYNTPRGAVEDSDIALLDEIAKQLMGEIEEY